MTKKSKHKSQQVQRNNNHNEAISDLDQLERKINYSDDFFVLAKEAGYFVIGTIVSAKVRIEKSGNIFQPFGKNIQKDFPVYFPVVIDAEQANNAEIIYGFNEHDMPILYLSKAQMQLDQYALAKILYDYTNKAFVY